MRKGETRAPDHEPTDVDDFLRGANFMSASGGGDPVVEREQLLADLEHGRDDRLDAARASFADDDVLFSVCYSGSIAPESFDDPEERAQALGGGRCTTRRSRRRCGCSRQQLGVALRRPDLDRDRRHQLGRDPERRRPARAAARRTATTPAARSRSCTRRRRTCTARRCSRSPASTTSATACIIRSSPSNAWAERIGKHLALSSLGLIACAFAALPASRVRGDLRARHDERVPRARPRDPRGARARRRSGRGGCGRARRLGALRGRGRGPRLGQHRLHGGHARARRATASFAGHRLKVWFRNENHVSWLDGEPWVAART